MVCYYMVAVQFYKYTNSGKAALNFKPFDGLSLQAIVNRHLSIIKRIKFRNQVSYTLMDNPDAMVVI